MVHGYRCMVVVLLLVVPHCRLLTGSDAAMFPPPRRSCWPQQAFSEWMIRSPVVPLLDLKGLLPLKWTRCPCMTLLAAASPCGCVSCTRPALPYAPGSNASGFAAAAFSALLASLMLAVPLARPGMAPATSSAPPTSCTLTPVD